MRLSENIVNDVPVDVRQAAIDAVVPECQLRVIDSQQMQHRGVHVIHECRIGSVQRFIAPFVAWAVTDPATNSAPCQPVGEDEWIVITSLSTLRARHSAKLGRPVNNGIVEHSALL